MARPHPRWVLAPVLGAPALHGPIMALDLLASWKRPIDGGATLRGRRLLGDNKTWRGAAAMVTGTLAATALLSRSRAYRARLPAEVRDASPLVVGSALGVAVVAGELPNSFAKRQLGIAPGTQRRTPAGVAISVVDQADWVPLACLLLRPVWPVTVREAAGLCALVAAIHVPINVVGYAIGARDSPL